MSLSTVTALVEPASMSSNRRQPVRQTRTRTVGRTLGEGAHPAQHEPPQVAPGFFPAIMHFTDSITALPKEMVKHYSLLKEVDAKTYHPEEALKRLSHEALKGPPPQSRGPMNIMDDFTDPAVFDELFDRQHRELHLQIRMVASGMMGILDEKNHVIGSATDNLEQLLARCESAWPGIENEISETTRIGSLEHWAYANTAVVEKSKATAGEPRTRHQAASNSLAALANTAELEGRLDGRTVSTNRKHRAHQQPDSDFDEPKVPKRAAGGKGKRPEITSVPNVTGLGITNGTANKKRKIEKSTPAAGGHAMERNISSFNGSARGGASPRETPAVEAAKKRIRNTGGSLAAVAQGRKRAGTANSAANSPNLASSPVAGTLTTNPRVASTPAGGVTMQRQSSTRARQNSTQQPQPARAPSAAAKEANGTGHGVAAEPLASIKSADQKSTKTEETSNSDVNTRSSGRSTDRGTLKREETSTSRHHPPSIATGTRNNGKASKNGTPVASTFPDTTRPRSGRNTNVPALTGDAPIKRSHKKGGGIGAQQAAAAKLAAAQEAARAVVGDENTSDAGEDDEPAEGEPIYCYCEKVSYGQMIGCDADHCKREWFHLGCVGMDKIPDSDEKWYCRDCAPSAPPVVSKKR